MGYLHIPNDKIAARLLSPFYTYLKLFKPWILKNKHYQGMCL